MTDNQQRLYLKYSLEQMCLLYIFKAKSTLILFRDKFQQSQWYPSSCFTITIIVIRIPPLRCLSGISFSFLPPPMSLCLCHFYARHRAFLMVSSCCCLPPIMCCYAHICQSTSEKRKIKHYGCHVLILHLSSTSAVHMNIFVCFSAHESFIAVL